MRYMECTLMNILMGYFIGCMFGVGCALAVLYSIYLGGYRRALRDAMLEEKPQRYLKALEYIRRYPNKGLLHSAVQKRNQ